MSTTAVYARTEDALDALLSARYDAPDAGSAETLHEFGHNTFEIAAAEPAEEYEDGDRIEYFDADTPALRIFDEAREARRVWFDDLDEADFGERPVVVFLDEDPTEHLDADERANHPDVRVFPASPDLPFPDLLERFEREGLDVRRFAPDAGGIGVPGLRDSATLRADPPPPRVYLEDGFIEEKAVNKITGTSGGGKTLITAPCAVSWSLGMSALDVDAEGKPRRLDRSKRVLYVDGELGEDWWRRYLDKFGFPRHLPNFHLRTLTDDAEPWPALSTEEGAAKLLEYVREVRRAAGGLDVIVLDTLSAFVGGEESSNDTWHDFDRLVTLRLKAEGLTVVYVDHTGHDTTRARGASSKKSKLDVEWVLEVPNASKPDALRLTNAKMRNGFDGHPRVFHLERRDSPLRHVRVERSEPGDRMEPAEDPRVPVLVVALDKAKLPIETSRRSAGKALRAAGHSFDDRVLSVAIQARKEREKALEIGGEQ